MTSLQKLVAAILPRRWVESLEADSRLWMARCSCGFARSVWDWGGIRGKAAGTARRLTKCPQCSQCSWHTVSRDPQAASLPGKT